MPSMGTCLLLYFGTQGAPRLIVIDGGPSGVFRSQLKKRLKAIKTERSPDTPLPIRMVMISHIDDDHIRGVLDWFEEFNDLRENGRELPQNILTLWHNSFDDLVKHDADELLTALESEATTAARGGSVSTQFPMSRDSAAVVASVRQGRRLRELASAFALSVNEGFDDLVMAKTQAGPTSIDAGGNLRFLVIGPSKTRLDELQAEWDRQLDKMGLARTARLPEFSDESVFNLASVTVLAEATQGRKTSRILLTGDARGDDILSGLKQAELLNRRGKLYVDLLKMPHHGSERDVSTFFLRILRRIIMSFQLTANTTTPTWRHFKCCSTLAEKPNSTSI
ncbi:ComEC/Rec2 family competence protein [Thalassoroseus pseudoceratinae]|uniref:hypothetical protein n=1 Tax=Thalassoroseus pseudoceratinae TaxID=2713176 RepID=UPI001421BF6B|nr:hypothetical protein [Thalassoroseus pseudoceratinae]